MQDSEDDFSDITAQQESSIDGMGRMVRRIIKMISNIRFNTGDYLIKQTKDWVDGKDIWVTDMIGNDIYARKYKVVAVDRYGLPFVQQILYNGEMQKSIRYVCNFDPDQVKYKLDPDYENHILLGNDPANYDPQRSYADERRKK